MATQEEIDARDAENERQLDILQKLAEELQDKGVTCAIGFGMCLFEGVPYLAIKSDDETIEVSAYLYEEEVDEDIVEAEERLKEQGIPTTVDLSKTPSLEDLQTRRFAEQMANEVILDEDHFNDSEARSWLNGGQGR